MFICYYVHWDEDSGDGDLVVQLLPVRSKDGARATFVAAESVPRSDVGVLPVSEVTKNAEAVGTPRGERRKFFACLWLAEPHRTIDDEGECWAFVFETATAADAARNLYLHRFSLQNETVPQVQAVFELNGFGFSLSDIDADSLTEIVEEHIYKGTDGYREYTVNHCILAIDDLQRRGRVEIQGQGTPKQRKKRRLDDFRTLMEELSKKERPPEHR